MVRPTEPRKRTLVIPLVTSIHGQIIVIIYSVLLTVVAPIGDLVLVWVDLAKIFDPDALRASLRIGSVVQVLPPDILLVVRAHSFTTRGRVLISRSFEVRIVTLVIVEIGVKVLTC